MERASCSKQLEQREDLHREEEEPPLDLPEVEGRGLERLSKVLAIIEVARAEEGDIPRHHQEIEYHVY